MKRAFLEFLIDRGVISRQDVKELQENFHARSQPIGTIAGRNGLIRQEDIDAILSQQKHRHRPFGEIAIELGIMSYDQVDNILFVQRVERVTAVAERLVITGRCRRREILQEMVHFLPSTETPSLIARETVWSILTNTAD